MHAYWCHVCIKFYLVELLFRALGSSKQAFLFFVVCAHLVAREWTRLHGSVMGFNEEPVDKASNGSSNHGGYNRHPPPVTNTAM